MRPREQRTRPRILSQPRPDRDDTGLAQQRLQIFAVRPP